MKCCEFGHWSVLNIEHTGNTKNIYVQVCVCVCVSVCVCVYFTVQFSSIFGSPLKVS